MSSFVLIVDDNRDAADTLAQLVRCLGYSALAVYHGDTAIRQAAVQKPDLVLIDLKMPGPDGFAVADSIRRQPAGRHTLLVAVTGLTGDEAQRQAYAAGFDLYLTKPTRVEDLTRILNVIDNPAPVSRFADVPITLAAV